MEAASLAAGRGRGVSAGNAIRGFIDRFGLYILLLVAPVAFGIHDLGHDHNLTRLGQNLLNGLSNGAIWSLVALGYTLVYGIIELINFAHGDVFMIGSFVSFSFWTTLGLTVTTATGSVIVGLLVTLVVAMFVCGSLNVMIERVAYRPLRNAPKLAPLITAVGSPSSCRMSASSGWARPSKASPTSSVLSRGSSRSSASSCIGPTCSPLPSPPRWLPV